MFESLSLTNFQRFRKFSFDFGKEATSIVGKSDEGKSTIIRALRWICLNEAPKNLIHHGTDFVRGKLKVDGHTIIRKKSNKVNCYILDGKKFSAVKKDVPEEIQSILNVTEVNFQSQLEPHFWFSKTSGQVSKELNQIVNLGVIDQSLFNVASRRRKEKVREEVIRDRLRQANDKTKELEWVIEADEQLQQIEYLQDCIAVDKDNRDSIQSILDSVQFHISELEQLDSVLYFVSGLVDDVGIRLKRERELQQLQTIIEEYGKLSELVSMENSLIEMDALLNSVDMYLEQKKEWAAISELRNTIIEKQENIEKWNDELNAVNQEIETKTGGKCPICSNPIQFK